MQEAIPLCLDQNTSELHKSKTFMYSLAKRVI